MTKKKIKSKAGQKRSSRSAKKSVTIIELLRSKEGATLAELVKATGWQAHSIRGFLSGQIGKKLGLKLESSRREDGERVYRVGS